MTDEPETPPVVVVEGELLPAPKRKGGRPRGRTKASSPDRVRGGATPANPKHRKVVWLDAARVVDLEAYTRLRAAGLGARKIGRALGTTHATAQKLMSGVHWQQTPDKVRLFNKVRGGSIDPETGMPTAADLAKFGGAYTGPTAHDTQGEKDLRQLVESTGVAPGLVDETIRNLKMLSGLIGAGDLPGKPDTKYFQDTIDEKLKVALACVDPVKLAGASLNDLTRFIGMASEKRALMRGEPTAIVRNEQRGSLDDVAKLLLAELQRRGNPVLDLPKGPGGYQEVQNGEG